MRKSNIFIDILSVVIRFLFLVLLRVFLRFCVSCAPPSVFLCEHVLLLSRIASWKSVFPASNLHVTRENIDVANWCLYGTFLNFTSVRRRRLVLHAHGDVYHEFRRRLSQLTPLYSTAGSQHIRLQLYIDIFLSSVRCSICQCCGLVTALAALVLIASKELKKEVRFTVSLSLALVPDCSDWWLYWSQWEMHGETNWIRLQHSWHHSLAQKQDSAT